MLTIGIDYTSAIHQSAGIGRYTNEMVQALARLNLEPHPQYRLFSADAGQDANPNWDNHHLSWHPTRLTERWLTRLWYRLQLPLPVEWWTGPVDVFHAPDFFLPPVKPNTKTVVTIHDLSFVREPSSVMPGMSHHLNTWVPRSVERADHVIAVSEATRQDLIELYNTPPQKITTLYHGVSPEFQPIEDKIKLSEIRQKYELGEAPFILSVSTLQPRKNYQRLIQAFAKIEAPFELVLAGGKGWHYEAIFAEVERQGLSGRVHFPGFIADADLPYLYNLAETFIYPSLYEGFGIPLLEAMACGIPVAAANRSALPEVVEDAGLLFDPFDIDEMCQVMRQLLTDSNLQQHYIQTGFQQVKKFSWDTMAAALFDIYISLTRK